jgi:3-oxoacyl-[acyl-carrier-protein] synthase-1
MVAPNGEGAKRCMQLAIATTNGPIDYINAHGTSTPVGDAKELGAIKAVFGDNVPYVGSTKSLSGHALGAAGVNESIYSLLMLQNDFMAESVNINTLDEAATNVPIVRTTTAKSLNRVMSNSFGFGGTNACLVFEKFKQ